MESRDRVTAQPTESDLIHEQLRESPVQRWVLLDGNRHAIITLCSVLVFVVCAAIGGLGLIPVTEPGTATTLVGAVVGGTLPFITIVLAINQLVLSQELGWPGGLMERFHGMTTLRREVEGLVDEPVSPPAPADFLQLLMENIDHQAAALEEGLAELDDPADTAPIERLIGSITDEAAVVDDTLETASLETFDALSAVLGHFNGAHLYAARLLRSEHAANLPAEGQESLETLIELLGHLAVARQTFKTLYMQHELAHLSKLLLYVGFPTLLGGGLFMMSYPRMIELVGNPVWLVGIVSGTVTLVFLPFVVLLVYTFRIATVASRTADFGPFVPRVAIEQGDDGTQAPGA